MKMSHVGSMTHGGNVLDYDRGLSISKYSKRKEKTQCMMLKIQQQLEQELRLIY